MFPFDGMDMLNIAETAASQDSVYINLVGRAQFQVLLLGFPVTVLSRGPCFQWPSVWGSYLLMVHNFKNPLLSQGLPAFSPVPFYQATICPGPKAALVHKLH
jgi:hypothetical protein